MRPNVLLVVLDAARRDAFEPYGAPPGSTPAVAQLAARGAARPSVYATAPWTLASHASFFTGLMPRAAGVSEVASMAAGKATLAAHESRFLPEVLRRAGYATAGFSANPWASELSGLAYGCDEFTLVDTARKTSSDWKRLGRLRWLAESARGRVDDGARAVGRGLGRFVDASAAKPFFCFVNLIECHSPYLPPRPYGDVSILDRLRAAEDARRFFQLETLYRVNGRALRMPEAALDRAQRLYRGAVRYMDDWLAGVFERLDRAGRLDDTLVIVTADHGENFGENQLLGHMFSLDERLIHVPFVVAGPGAEHVDLHSLADLPRSIATAAGIDDHPWHDAPPAGFGLAQAEPIGDPTDENLYRWLDEVGLVDEAGRRVLTSPLSAAVRGDLKLVRRGDREELFDLSADPLEEAPLAPDQIEPARACELDDLRGALDHPAMTAVAAGDARVDAGAGASEQEMRDLEERMKMLGYM